MQLVHLICCLFSLACSVQMLGTVMIGAPACAFFAFMVSALCRRVFGYFLSSFPLLYFPAAQLYENVRDALAKKDLAAQSKDLVREENAVRSPSVSVACLLRRG